MQHKKSKLGKKVNETNSTLKLITGVIKVIHFCLSEKLANKKRTKVKKESSQIVHYKRYRLRSLSTTPTIPLNCGEEIHTTVPYTRVLRESHLHTHTHTHKGRGVHCANVKRLQTFLQEDCNPSGWREKESLSWTNTSQCKLWTVSRSVWKKNEPRNSMFNSRCWNPLKNPLGKKSNVNLILKSDTNRHLWGPKLVTIASCR